MKDIISDEELIIKYLTASASDDENEELLNRVNGNTDTKAMFDSMTQTWNKVSTKENAQRFDSNKAYESFLSQINENHSDNKKRSLTFIFSSIAATILFLVGLFYFISPSPPEIQSVINKDNKITNQVLPDGSTLTLNKFSKIEYPKEFTGKYRKIKMLSGEVFFEIEPNKSKPFIIDVSNIISVEVVGTSFNIEMSKDGNIEINVTTGIVCVTHNETGSFIKVHANEQVIYNAAQNKLLQYENNNPNYLSWKTKKLVFDNVKIPEVIKEIEKCYQVKINYPEYLNNNKLTSKFDNQPLKNILEVLELTYQVKAEMVSDSVINLK